MFTKRELEGYVRIDHRESPGLPGTPFAKGTLFEGPTYKCPYCQFTVVVNPARTRERAYCSRLDRYICDSCGAKRKLGIDLKPITQLIDEFLTQASKGAI